MPHPARAAPTAWLSPGESAAVFAGTNVEFDNTRRDYGERRIVALGRSSCRHARREAAISIRLDQDVLEFFRATGPRYQSHINAVLRSHVEHVTSTTSARRKRAV